MILKARVKKNTKSYQDNLSFLNYRYVFTCLCLLIVLVVYKQRILDLHRYLSGAVAKGVYNEYMPGELLRKYMYKIDRYLFVLENKERILANEKELSLLKVQNKLLLYENNQLKELKSFHNSRNFDAISSRILMKKGDDIQQHYIIDIGKLHGVKLGNAVMMKEQLIGRIISVTENSSIVQIITESGFEVPVIILDEEVQALALAQFNSNLLELDYLSRSVNLSDGSVAITSGEGGIMPYGLYVGKAIIKDQKYYIDANLKSFSGIVSVLIDKKELKYAESVKD